MTDEKDTATRKWIDDGEDALNKIGQALKAAWEESHEARTATLQSAKEVVSEMRSIRAWRQPGSSGSRRRTGHRPTKVTFRPREEE